MSSRVVFLLVLGAFLTGRAQQPAPISRIDFFDRSDNALAHLALQYNASGVTIGRALFMADSTFVRSTVIDRGPTGTPLRETSFNAAGDTILKTQFTSVNGKPAISITDQFMLDELGGPVSYSGDGVSYDILQRGSVINRMRYTEATNGDVRIDVLDNAGVMQYYATAKTSASGVVDRAALPARTRSSLKTAGLGTYRVTVALTEPSTVTVELFEPSGRRAAVLLKTSLGAGAHVVAVRVPARLAAGCRLVRFSVRAGADDRFVTLAQGPAKSMAPQAAAETVSPGLVFEVLALNGDLETARRPRYRSPTALVASPDGRTLYVAEQTAKRVAVIDTASRTVTKEILLPNDPTGLALSSDGSRLYVTCSSERWPSGAVCVVDPAAGRITKTIAAGHSARSPVLSPDGSTLYVCNWFDNTVSVIDMTAGRETGRIALTREPYAAAITPDGRTLVVTNSLPDQKATDTSAIACKVTLIKTATRTIDTSIALPVGSHSLFGIAVSPDGAYAFATHLIGRMTIPATTLSGGWVHSNNLAVIDIANRRLANDLELDDMNHGTANPWGLAATADGKFLCVLHAGSNEMTVIDLPAMMVKAKGAANLSHEFTALQGLKKVIPISARGPRSLAIVGGRAYVAGYFSDSLDVADVKLSGTVTARIPLGPGKAMTAERTGEFLFTDASLCYQKWQSCSSCHPFSRPDALNWILNQAVNNAPKNVKSMLYAFQTPPMNWSGRRPNAWESVRKGVEIELQTVPTTDVALPLDTFIMRLKPVPSPHLIKGRLSDSALRGKAVFARSDCATCHGGPLYTDMRKWNAGVNDPFDPNLTWDSPSLIEAWRTGPYDHLGSHETLEGIVKVPGHSSDAGRLSVQEFNDLMAFLRSL